MKIKTVSFLFLYCFCSLTIFGQSKSNQDTYSNSLNYFSVSIPNNITNNNSLHKEYTYFYKSNFYKSNNLLSTNLESIINIRVSRSPQKILITKDNKYAFVSCYWGNCIEVIDIVHQVKFKTLIIPSPSSMIFNRDSTKIFVGSSTNYFIDSTKPNDCGINVLIDSGGFLLTEINVENQNITRNLSLNFPGGASRLLNAEEDGLIFIIAGGGLIKINIQNFQLLNDIHTSQLFAATIDNKNKKIFYTLNNWLVRLDYVSGQIDSVRFNVDSLGLSNFIMSDTTNNRIFASTSVGKVIVYNAATLQIIASLNGVNSIDDILILPERNSLYLTGAMYIDPYNTWRIIREYDYTSLNVKKNMITGGNRMVYDKINKCIYSMQVADYFYSTASWELDITKYDLNTEKIKVYNCTNSLYDCCFIRSIAITTDYKYVISTNSPENTISILSLDQSTGISDNHKLNNYSLTQNYPNPFNPSTTIEYQLMHSSVIKINIYSVDGKLIRELLNQEQNSGNHSITWNGTNNDGAIVPSGIYFYQIQTDDFIQAKKMVLLK
jgi:hypothetical protein